MAFVRTESWVEERPSVASDVLAQLLQQRWLRNGVALTVSLAIDAGLILALISLGRITHVNPSRQRQESIQTFDIASVTAQQQGARMAATASAPATPPAPATSTPPPPLEWSVTTLPPAAPPAAPAPSAPVAALPAPAQGAGTSGMGSGAGYDPYAFASYQKPDPARLGGSMHGALQPLPDALARLSAALTNGRDHLSIDIRAYVDPTGHVLRAELVSVPSPDIARRLAQVAPGFALCAADPMRPSGMSLVVTVSV